MNASLSSQDLIQTPEELIRSFRQRDQKHVQIPKSMPFPLELGNYLAWNEPSGVRVYLVFKKPEWPRPVGVVFRRDQPGGSASPACMCEWCHATGPADEVGLLTVTVNAHRRVGLNLCLNLDCVDKLETSAQLMGQDASKSVEKHRERMAHFCRQVLGLVGRVQDYF